MQRVNRRLRTAAIRISDTNRRVVQSGSTPSPGRFVLPSVDWHDHGHAGSKFFISYKLQPLTRNGGAVCFALRATVEAEDRYALRHERTGAASQSCGCKIARTNPIAVSAGPVRNFKNEPNRPARSAHRAYENCTNEPTPRRAADPAESPHRRDRIFQNKPIPNSGHLHPKPRMRVGEHASSAKRRIWGLSRSPPATLRNVLPRAIFMDKQLL
jgi:hypothetical protein